MIKHHWLAVLSLWLVVAGSAAVSGVGFAIGNLHLGIFPLASLVVALLLLAGPGPKFPGVKGWET